MQLGPSKIALALRLAFILLIAGAAARAVASAENQGVCRDDERRLCADAKDRSQRIECLNSHMNELSNACREALVKMRARGKAFEERCGGDRAKFCADLKGRALTECLAAHTAQLSAGCREMLADIKKSRRVYKEKIAAACRTDAETFCKDVRPGQGRIHSCLTDHLRELSKECAEALSPH